MCRALVGMHAHSWGIWSTGSGWGDLIFLFLSLFEQQTEKLTGVHPKSFSTHSTAKMFPGRGRLPGQVLSASRAHHSGMRCLALHVNGEPATNRISEYHIINKSSHFCSQMSSTCILAIAHLSYRLIRRDMHNETEQFHFIHGFLDEV